MKKFIALVTVMLACTISAAAQENKMSVAEAAKNDIVALTSKIQISESLQNDLLTLMTMKHELIADKSISKENKEAALKQYEHKLMSALTQQQREKLTKNPELLRKLTH